MLDADIQLRLSRLDLDMAFTVGEGEVVALLGPNGSGKSTALRALTGLLPLAGGRVALDGTVLEEPEKRVKVAPERRPIALSLILVLVSLVVMVYRRDRSGAQ